MLDNVSYQVDPEKAHQTFRSKKTKENFLWEIAKSELEAKYEILGTDEVIAQFQRMAILKAIDENWVEQVDYLQQLRMALSGQYTSQKNPLVEFFQEAYQSFERMKEAAKEQMVRNLLLSRVEINKRGNCLAFPIKEDIMTVYNINLGIGWASSGVEYAQAYRAQLLRNIHQPAKFVLWI